jgi:predicted transcriptional regulator
MKTLTLKLPDALDRQLTVLVSQRGVNKSVLIREAIERYLSDSKAIQAGSFLDLAGNLVGCVEGPADLSTNPAHLEGFGK